jgi:hypothetical protein
MQGRWDWVFTGPIFASRYHESHLEQAPFDCITDRLFLLFAPGADGTAAALKQKPAHRFDARGISIALKDQTRLRAA